MTTTIEVPKVTASEEDWRHKGRCRNEDRSLFFPPPTRPDSEEEPAHASPEVKKICSWCPVRPECLAYALDNRIEYGVFAGMSGYERSLLVKKRNRRRCPGCGSDEVFALGRNQVCGACAVSWDVDVPPDDEYDD
jgi:WhiB family transcriptional regulator, redox-sensing transcriptional regulator